jgi:hypothetical protein
MFYATLFGAVLAAAPALAVTTSSATSFGSATLELTEVGAGLDVLPIASSENFFTDTFGDAAAVDNGGSSIDSTSFALDIDLGASVGPGGFASATGDIFGGGWDILNLGTAPASFTVTVDYMLETEATASVFGDAFAEAFFLFEDTASGFLEEEYVFADGLFGPPASMESDNFQQTFTLDPSEGTYVTAELFGSTLAEDPVPIPLPSTAWLLLGGVAALAVRRRGVHRSMGTA